MAAADVQATFCATLVDEWVRGGVNTAVVAPGSRSTPMALALTDRSDIGAHVVHDERCAAFVALGAGLGGVPAVLLCTSGTAAANLHPAVVEAGLSDVPMIVVTADRPPELRDVGAPQTIDQTHLFGRSVRWFHDPGVADDRAATSWRSLGRRALDASSTGPVHLNLPFREPLLGRCGPLPAARPHVGAIGAADDGQPPDGLFDLVSGRRGLIVAGGRSGVSTADITALVERSGWPLLADPTSGVRSSPDAIGCFDALLRHEPFASAHRPDVVVRIGRPPASKVLAQWLSRSEADVLQVGGPGVIDPDHVVTASVPPSLVRTLAAELDGRCDGAWSASWVGAADRAEAAIVEVVQGQNWLTEPGVARAVADSLPPDAQLVVASSMPVRDLEWYGGPRARAHANRGANGIDGVVSTALGVALGGAPTLALVGDIAFVHDASALVALRHRGVDLRIVVVDNDGGGIFSFLPQASDLPPDRFELLFGTPHGTDVAALASAHGISASTVETADELATAVTTKGSSVTHVATDRSANVNVHDQLHAAVAAAL